MTTRADIEGAARILLRAAGIGGKEWTGDILASHPDNPGDAADLADLLEAVAHGLRRRWRL